MSFKFSEQSLRHLQTCDHDLQEIFHHVIEVIDCQVIEGARGQMRQNELNRTGMSRVLWPNSKHNTDPSLAVDVAPYPIDWNDRERFVYFAGIVKGIAHGLGYKIRWGGDWDGDNDLRDQTFMDLVHFELIL